MARLIDADEAKANIITFAAEWCRFANYMVGDNAYCVYGERKDGGGNE